MTFQYRLALDLGSNSLGWAIFRLNQNVQPSAITIAGVRIFSDGRNPKDGTSLASTRREARSARRRRDRYLNRRKKLITALISNDFFPTETKKRKQLERLDPYEIRSRGITEKLHPHEFGRAIFHLNQRRGFKSNRKTDSTEKENSIIKQTISNIKLTLKEQGCETVGQWLYKRKQEGHTVRARLLQKTINTSGENNLKEKKYDLYIDRSMIEHEFDTLWKAQKAFNKDQYNDHRYAEIKDILFFQRRLRPVRPGRCTFFPEEPRASLALPGVQRFRILQELNNLRWLDNDLIGQSLTIEQRNLMLKALESSTKKTFVQLSKVANLEAVKFNLEDYKRTFLKGNLTSSVLSNNKYFGTKWKQLSLDQQDEVVVKLLNEESEEKLIVWIQDKFGIVKEKAIEISRLNLPTGYSNLSLKAIYKLIPILEEKVVTYDKAVIESGIQHHSVLDFASTGEVLDELPYYGSVLQRHVGFGTNNPSDSPEERYGRIANPTVHIGLNQLKIVINELIKRYGKPSQVVIELARDLKISKEKKLELQQLQAKNQKRNERIRKDISEALEINEYNISRELIHKYILWEELAPDVLDRKCPYTGEQISITKLLSAEVEIEHILPFSRTLDDSLSNKTVAMRRANKIKTNLTPWEAFGKQEIDGYNYSSIIERAKIMPKNKRYRFAPDGMENWLKNDNDFLERALNDTRYLSRIAKSYLEYICPNTWVITGQLTALFRSKYGLNESDIIGWNGQKNRNDHRHHAVDACVIGVMDRNLLQKVASANAKTTIESRDKLISEMPLPWDTYRQHVKRAVSNIWVSHKPDHGYEGAISDSTARGILPNGMTIYHRNENGIRRKVEEKLTVIPIISINAADRHGYMPDGNPRPYKGYKGNSNYCIEITKDSNTGKWLGEVIATYKAYEIIRKHGKEKGWKILRNNTMGLNGDKLIMRLIKNDIVRFEHQGNIHTARLSKIGSNGQIFFADIHEANVDARDRDKNNPFSYISKTVGTLYKSKGRRITISPAGRLRDQGFKP